MYWDKMGRRGNPTRSIAINNFIKLLKKLEVKKLGVELKARRAMTEVEFKKIKELSFKKSLVVYHITRLTWCTFNQKVWSYLGATLWSYKR